MDRDPNFNPVYPPYGTLGGDPGVPNEMLMTAFTYVKALSGSSTVAIDNKIEQAMDLVKSHLMYAVREEVEVLKEQIKELMERMHKLEHENKLLRSEASPETLAKLPAPLPPLQNPLLQQLMTSLHNPASSSSSS